MGIAGLLLNSLIAVLLVTTIAYCWILNRRIKVLQDSKSELAQLLSHFDESTQRASESIIALQTASKKIGENIQFRIDKANYLLDDLGFMIEKGNKIVNEMEAGFAVSRARNKAMTEQHIEVAEEVLVRAPVKEKEYVLEKSEAQSNREKTAASLEAVLERVVSRNKFNTEIQDEKPPERPVERPQRQQQQMRTRSQAEQELLDMIRVGIKG